LCSTAWSIEPGMTLRRAAVILGTTLIGVYCGATYSIAAFQKVVIRSIMVMLIASGAVFLVNPAMVIDPSYGGSLQGLTEAKNYFAEYLTLLLILVITDDRWPRLRGSRSLVLLGGAVLLFLAHSDTAVLSLLPVVIVVIPILLFLRRAPGLAIPVLAIILLVAIVAGIVAPPTTGSVFTAVGRDSGMTGRDNIWVVAWQAIEKRPFLGYGFDAYWGSPRGGQLYATQLGWMVPHSHDGYLETMLGLGMCGLGLVLLAIARTGLDAVRYYWKSQGLASVWPIALIVLLLLHAIAESDLVARHGLPYLVLIAVSIQLAQERKGLPKQVAADGVVELAGGRAYSRLAAV
jgi:exopolysaccharide production protein ExoQ